jgi:sodium transport system permease protein
MSTPTPSRRLQLRAIASKEALDALRDRRSMVSAILYPLLMPLLVAAMFAYLTETMSDERELILETVGKDRAPHLIEHLEEHGAVVKPYDGDAEQAVEDGDVELALVVSEEFPEDFAAGRPAVVEIVYDGADKEVAPLAARAEALVQGYASRVAMLRVIARGVDPAVLSPVRLERRDVATGAQRSAQFFMMLPMFLIMAAFVASLNVAIDATAGERERQSLEPLLTAPVPRSVLLGGKWLVTTVFSVVGVLLTLVTFTAAMSRISFADLGFELHLGPTQLAWVVLLLFPIALLVPALQLLVATFARSYKEAQTYVSLLMLVPMAPGIIATMRPIDAEGWMMWIPALSHQVLLTDVMSGDPLAPLSVVACLSSTLLATGVLLAATTRMLRDERIVFGR